MSSRHKSRELAVQFVFQEGFKNHSSDFERKLESFWTHQAQSQDDNQEYFEKLARGVKQHLPTIDSQIEQALENWRFERVDKLDLAILRVALFELKHSSEKIPGAIVIDEALNIAKKFCEKNSSSFINGLLDAIMKKKDHA